MDEYIAKIPDLSEKALKFKGEKLSDEVRTELSSLLGQTSWAARQGRHELLYGVSHCQQLMGLGEPDAIKYVQKLLVKAREKVEIKVKNLGCRFGEVIVISASDAAYAAQPRAGSQGGVVCLLAHPDALT